MISQNWRRIAALICLSLTLCLTACGPSTPSRNEQPSEPVEADDERPNAEPNAAGEDDEENEDEENEDEEGEDKS